MSDILKQQDLQLTSKTLADQYYTYFKNGQITAAHNLLDNNTSLNSQATKASYINEITTGITELETLFFTNVINNLANKLQTYINNIDNCIYINTYDSTVAYNKFNFVLYEYNTYMCIQSAEAGITPTNTAYWINIGLRGENGSPGIGIKYIGEWESTTQYNMYDMVTYNNSLYVAFEDNTGYNPAGICLRTSLYLSNTLYLSSDKWLKIMSVQSIPIYVFPNDYTTLPINSIFISNNGS